MIRRRRKPQHDPQSATARALRERAHLYEMNAAAFRDLARDSREQGRTQRAAEYEQDAKTYQDAARKVRAALIR
jgi:CRP-like cAMP-binding protein